ncbi:hypothetical protein LOK49_Contig304G00001 [Camellia lanceoleosa]|nr:hypothetical protein LOK49_Contig304G00001 [Camellia lanceoleosa]
MSSQNPSPNERVPQLPVQVLTLQASNLLSEDLTLTVLAPTSFTSPPSVLSLNSAPSTPMSPFVGHFESSGKGSGERRISSMLNVSSKISCFVKTETEWRWWTSNCCLQ